MNPEQLTKEIESLAARIKLVEKTTGVLDREIPVPCPWCNLGEKRIEVKPVEHWFAVRCLNCGAMGPNMARAQDAIWSWNQFVTHRGTVPLSENNYLRKETDYGL